VPFIGVGFGSDQGVQTLSLRASGSAAQRGAENIFQRVGANRDDEYEELPHSICCCFAMGRCARKRRSSRERFAVVAGKLQVTEEKQGVHNYAVQLLPPSLTNLKSVNLLANTSVRDSDEKELRVLYVRGR